MSDTDTDPAIDLLARVALRVGELLEERHRKQEYRQLLDTAAFHSMSLQRSLRSLAALEQRPDLATMEPGLLRTVDSDLIA